MDGGGSARLVGTDIHGFHTFEDLDVQNTLEDAKSRWLRPNEIHAILCNHKDFSIHVKPVNLPKSGTIVLFDRKMLRNFRKDGHNWKKKKDGKTVKEAHEHLKVGDEERIHVYYAHGQDNPTFVRRCYWLLDKSLEHIVLVHYRETREASPATPVNSNSSSITDQSTSLLVTEEFDSGTANADHEGPGDKVRNHEMRLHEINTLEWDELLVTNDANDSTASRRDKSSCFNQQNQMAVNGFSNDGDPISAYNLSTEISLLFNSIGPVAQSNNAYLSTQEGVCNQISGGEVNSTVQRKDSSALGTGDSLDFLVNDGLQSEESFGKWINDIMTEPPGSVGDPVLESSISSAEDSFSLEQIFSITVVSPGWAYSTEKTKIVVTGVFHQAYQQLVKSNLFCVCGDICTPAEIIQVGVYRCPLSQHSPGLVNLYMSLDGHKPISQVLSFEYRTPLSHDQIVPPEGESRREEFLLQMRLAYLLFSTSKSLNILLSNKVSPNTLKEAKKFAQKTTNISDSWTYLIKSFEENRASFTQAKDSGFYIALKNRLRDWLLERIIEGGKTTEYDTQGQGVLHLCAILGYTWAIYLFSWSGLSLDFRDKHGWTALHWAAFYGREKMVAILLSAGAKPNLVTDPTTQNPSGFTAADLASLKGYEGLAAYLSEEALVAQFNDMAVAGNASGSLQTGRTEATKFESLNEDELYLKESLAAYRTAADAAARIQTAIREHSLKIRTKAVESSHPEVEARNIVAAMKIQHAFRSYETKKKMAAAARIQYRFRAWKMRKDFLNMRRQAIKIQSTFRGFQVRRQYGKILWSVGVLEKAILRWRLKRKGFRGLKINTAEAVPEQSQESDTEEDFYRTSRIQAEERVEKSVVRVQALFRSKKAQEEYRRMKLAHDLAKLEYANLLGLPSDMDTCKP